MVLRAGRESKDQGNVVGLPVTKQSPCMWRGLLPWDRTRSLGNENRRERTGLRAEPGGQSLLWREPRASYLWETLLIQRATRIRESTSLLRLS